MRTCGLYTIEKESRGIGGGNILIAIAILPHCKTTEPINQRVPREWSVMVYYPIEGR